MEKTPRTYLKIGVVLAAAGAVSFLARLATALSSGQISAGGWGTDAVVIFADDPQAYYLQLVLELVRFTGCLAVLIVLLLRFRRARPSRTL